MIIDTNFIFPTFKTSRNQAYFFRPPPLVFLETSFFVVFFGEPLPFAVFSVFGSGVGNRTNDIITWCPGGTLKPAAYKKKFQKVRRSQR